jgi:hypothetical protein
MEEAREERHPNKTPNDNGALKVRNNLLVMRNRLK